jgi:hypothetical protein
VRGGWGGGRVWDKGSRAERQPPWLGCAWTDSFKSVTARCSQILHPAKAPVGNQRTKSTAHPQDLDTLSSARTHTTKIQCCWLQDKAAVNTRHQPTTRQQFTTTLQHHQIPAFTTESPSWSAAATC